MESPPRYVPDEEFPPYAYVPGRQPHPVSDPRGHSYGRNQTPVSAPDPGDPTACREYLRGIDLFNHGYYWEAHETWEALWHACGRSGVTADFLKGLIKLAAAGVKAREGNAAGMRRHAERARELFLETIRATGAASHLGLRLRELAGYAQAAAGEPPVDADPRAEGKRVFAFVLRLDGQSSPAASEQPGC